MNPKKNKLNLIFPRVIAEIKSSALINNYKVISKMVPNQLILPMIKADAYGHGDLWCARLLQKQKKLYGFGVATLEEGAALRNILNKKTKIIVFSGPSPWNESKGSYCKRYNLMPVISTHSDWNSFIRGGWTKKLDYELKFNTGMNRLGIPFDEASSIATLLRKKGSIHYPQGVMSHLAIGENPSHPVSKRQLKHFEAIKVIFESLNSNINFHLANSSGIWNHRQWKLNQLTQIVRPGLSLYGVPPWPGASQKGLKAVMTLKAQVILVLNLKKGESVGYGARYTAKKAEKICILGAGYADGWHRKLSNSGELWIENGKSKILGIVSMDLTAAACKSNTKVGDWAELLGPHLDPWKQAQAAGTIPYELLTSVTKRVQRRYI